MGVAVDGIKDVEAVLRNMQQTMAAIVQQLGVSFVSSGGNNIFTGTNLFKPPPSISAGATGIATFKPMGVLSSQFSVAGIGNGADLTDDTLFTYSLPASSLDANGQGVILEAWGKCGATANNKTIKLFFGATSFSSGVQVGNNVGWAARAIFTRTGASAQIGTGWGQSGATVWSAPIPLTPAEATSGAITLKVTGASPTTGAANDVVGNAFTVTFFN